MACLQTPLIIITTSKMPPPAISLLILSLLLPFSADACGITVYWGRNRTEGSLKSACSYSYPYYKYIVLASLTASPESPVLDLDGHCDPSLGNCKKLSSDIAYCQSRGIKVFLSMDGAFSRFSSDVADQLAQWVYNDYFSGRPGPLGKVVLDGIDFFIRTPSTTNFWPAFAQAISGYTTAKGKVYLSAAPQCTLPNAVYDDIIKTGLLDYVWVQFYKNAECDIRTGVSGVLSSWKAWSSYLGEKSPGSELLMGLSASPDVDGSSYIYPCVLSGEILPELRKSPNYGGLMLWNRKYDVDNSFSPNVIVPACNYMSPSPKLLSQVA